MCAPCLRSPYSLPPDLARPQVIDNSGALLIECVNVLKQKVNNGWGSVGDEIVCVVKRARPISGQASASAPKVRQGDVRRAVIVRTRKAVRRPDGRFIRFDDNAAVLLNNKREMLGTRIGGVVSADLRMKGWGKIVSLAPKVSVGLPGAWTSPQPTPIGCMIHRVIMSLLSSLLSMLSCSERAYTPFAPLSRRYVPHLCSSL